MQAPHAIMPRRIHVLFLICLITVVVTVTAVASLSAQGDDTAAGVYLPVIQAPGVTEIFSGTLQDGGILAGPDGLLLGTVSGTLTSPLQITITRRNNAAAALDPGIAPVGGFYDVLADSDLYLSAEHPLLIGLPVPDGADTAHLAMAVLIPDHQIPFGGDGQPHWFLFRGFYDEQSDLLVSAIGGLSLSGYQIVLVDAPNQTPLTPTGDDPLSPLQHLASFEVNCTTGYSAGQCGSTQEDKVAVELSKAYDDFQDLLGFPNPDLLDKYFSLDPRVVMRGYHSYYNIYLVPPPGSDCTVEGQYFPGGSLEICLPRGSSITADDIETIRHEYFHATQYGYDTILDKPKDRWVTDGTATAAQRSVMTMTRSLHYRLRKVDVPLTVPSDTHRYAAQDFFVFVGHKQQKQGLGYLKALFEKGAKTQDVVDVLGDGTHLPIYWEWAKNQAIERTIDYGQQLTDPCTMQASVVTSIDTWHFDHTKALSHIVGTVEPLNTVVVGIIWDGSYDIADGVVFPKEGPGDTEAVAALRYKFYREGEDKCHEIEDGPRLFEKENGEISPDNIYWVLISNIHPTEPHSYTIFFEVSPIPPN